VTEPLCRHELRREGTAQVVLLAGEIDLSNVRLVEADLRAIAQPTSDTIIVLDEITYLDSAAIAALERLARDNTNLRVVLAKSSPIYRAVTIAGLHSLIPIYESIAEAGS
jgi:anti-anti-sigma factor